MSLQATLMQNLRAKYAGTLDKNEERLSRYGGYELFRQDTFSENSIVDEDILTKAANSIGNTLDIPVINASDITITNARTCTLAVDESESALVTVVFVTYQFGFTLTPASYKNNDIKYEQDFQKKMLRAARVFAVELDNTAITQIETDKTTVTDSSFVGVGAKYGALVGDAIQVSAAQSQFFFNDLSTIMEEDDYLELYNVLGSTTLKSQVALYANQGGSNAENSLFQYGDYNFTYSNRVVVDTAGLKESTLYCMPKGTLATFNRNTPDCEAGTKIAEGEFYDVINLPVVDLNVGLHYKRECADSSGLNGGGQAFLADAVKETWIMSTDVAFITAYNSQPGVDPSPIHKAEIAA